MQRGVECQVLVPALLRGVIEILEVVLAEHELVRLGVVLDRTDLGEDLAQTFGQ
jgi:hypothetical protein